MSWICKSEKIIQSKASYAHHPASVVINIVKTILNKFFKAKIAMGFFIIQEETVNRETGWEVIAWVDEILPDSQALQGEEVPSEERLRRQN